MAGDFPQRLCDYDRRSDPHMEAGRRSRCPAGGREAVKLPGIEREPVEVEPVEAVEVVEAVTRSAVVTVAAEPCFTCDECRGYDGDTRKKSQWRQSCEGYQAPAKMEGAKDRAADRQARQLRANFRVIQGRTT